MPWSSRRVVLTFMTGIAFMLMLIGFFTPMIYGEATITVTSGWWIFSSTTTYDVEISASGYELALGQAHGKASESGTTQMSMGGELSSPYPLFWLVLLFSILMLAGSVLSRRLISILFGILAVIVAVIALAWALTDEVFSELAAEGLQVGPGFGFILLVAGMVMAIISEGIQFSSEREKGHGYPPGTVASPPPPSTYLGPTYQQAPPSYQSESVPGYPREVQHVPPTPAPPPVMSSGPPPPPVRQQPVGPPPPMSAGSPGSAQINCPNCGNPLSWIPQEMRNYCHSCQMYF